MSDPVAIPDGRDVRRRLDRPDADHVVVACPPHPEYGSSRSDPRLRAVSDALAPDVACLRFDYGPWDGGAGEHRDAENALSWAHERFDGVRLLGYSFGAGVALRAAVSLRTGRAPDACSVLAPPATGSVVAALDGIDCPLQVVYGERDDTVDWRPVVDRTRALREGGRPFTTASLPAGHHFGGRFDRVGTLVAAFLQQRL